MAKQKTKRGAAKRLKLKKSGVIMRRKAGKSHLLSSKSRKRKRRLRKPTRVSKSDRKRTKSLIY
ncbi:50S ribosomal protein L35 [candidate division WOR_3 bacterium SM23_42]|uniref:Large ribosomal subunit protein bL35 n=1 Tax=candidate division WOR_3 bacterium SM23_42 TaxID=1703779 RepID=A0A0S8FNF6_UNCW3|nr:MAG: 50S ribosomal protein L35 [candidate division WOR_3 bacterium SM23_42]